MTAAVVTNSWDSFDTSDSGFQGYCTPDGEKSRTPSCISSLGLLPQNSWFATLILDVIARQHRSLLITLLQTFPTLCLCSNLSYAMKLSTSDKCGCFPARKGNSNLIEGKLKYGKYVCSSS